MMFIKLNTLYEKLLPVNKKLNLYKEEEIKETVTSIKELKKENNSINMRIEELAQLEFNNDYAGFESYNAIRIYLSELSFYLNHSIKFLYSLYYHRKSTSKYKSNYLFQTKLISKLLQQINKKLAIIEPKEIKDIDHLLHSIRENSNQATIPFLDMMRIGILLSPERGYEVTNSSLEALQKVNELTYELNSKIILLLKKIIKHESTK